MTHTPPTLKGLSNRDCRVFHRLCNPFRVGDLSPLVSRGCSNPRLPSKTPLAFTDPANHLQANRREFQNDRHFHSHPSRHAMNERSGQIGGEKCNGAPTAVGRRVFRGSAPPRKHGQDAHASVCGSRALGEGRGYTTLVAKNAFSTERAKNQPAPDLNSKSRGIARIVAKK